MRMLIAALLCLPAAGAVAQDKVYQIKPGQMISDVIKKEDLYLYPAFQVGRVFFKSGETAAGLMNYHFMTGEMHFVDGKGDTLALDSEKTIQILTLGKDSFYFNEGYLKLVEGNNHWKLAKKQEIRMVKQEMAGAYDQGMPSAAVSYSSVRIGNQLAPNLVVRENTTLVNQTEYFIGDKFNRFHPVNRKNILKLFSKQEKQVEAWLDQHQVNFKKEEDLKQVFSFLKSL